MSISSAFFEIAAIFVSMGAFYFLGFELGYNRGMKEGIKVTLETCKSMSDVIVQIAFGGSDEQEETREEQ